MSQIANNPVFVFLRVMLKSPRKVCSLAPSSRTLARRMAAGLEIKPNETVMELGPGTGALTEEIKPILSHDTGYIGIELESKFVGLLQTRFPELQFEQENVTRAFEVYTESGVPPVKAIISGLPISTMPKVVIDDLIGNLEQLLEPGAVFRMFQYVHAYYLPCAVRFRRRMSTSFSKYRCEGLVIKNLPPALVLTWTR